VGKLNFHSYLISWFYRRKLYPWIAIFCEDLTK